MLAVIVGFSVLMGKLTFSAAQSLAQPIFLPIVTTMPPAPQLVIIGWEDFPEYRRYWLSIANWGEFPADMFEPAPDLPPCGLNSNASRMWIDIYATTDKRLYGFCGLHEPEDMTQLWFAVEASNSPPDGVCVVLEDRRTGLSYRSNNAAVEP
jgi:hypothetical protein